jgi:hypothetical protein
LLRKHKATPILVLQVTQVEQEPSVQDLQLDDYRAVKGLVLKLTKDNAHTTTDKISRIRAYKTQVLVEVVRRTGNAQGVQVIDPRQAFAQYSGASRLFCDEIHLTDLGSQLLASAIAARLDLSTVTDRSARN